MPLRPGAVAGWTVVGITAAVAMYYGFRNTLHNRLYSEIVAGMESAQRLAVINFTREIEAVGIPLPPDPLPSDSQFFKVGEFEFAYTVDRTSDDHFVHHVIGRNGNAGELSEAMLCFMRRLVQQFGPADLEHEVMLHVEVQDLTGTQHIDFMLDAAQHAALSKSINA